MKTALILEGGAMRGLYSAGVLDTFLENDIKFDCIIGVSAGALFGINYLSKQKGRVLRYNKRYARDKRYMGFHSLITTGNIMNKKFCFKDLVYELDKFDFDEYKKSDTKFYATLTNVETGKAEYVQIEDVENDMEYLRASGSMPLVSKIVEIDGKKYLDGGMADSVPIKKIEEMGYEKIVVVLTRPIEYRKEEVGILPYKIIYKKYPKFVNTVTERHIKYNDTVEYIKRNEKSGNVFVIRPSKTVKVKRIEKNVEKLQEIYDLGVKDSKEKMETLKKYLK